MEHFIFSDLMFVVVDRNYDDQMKLVGLDILETARNLYALVRLQ